MPRLFVAITPPETVRAEMAALAAPLEGARWVREDQLHLTMRFIGERDDAQTDAIVGTLERVRVEPFILPVEGVGTFPPGSRAKVLWAGLGHAHTRLFQLRKQVDDALLRVALDLDVRHFHPHMTLARLGETVDGRALALWLKQHARFEAPPFRVSEIVLYASELQPAGATYSVVRTFPLHKD